jgi:CHAT domain-containing protein
MSPRPLEELRAPIDQMIADGRAGTDEVTAAADPVVMQLAAGGYGNEAVWLLRDSLVPSPRHTWDELRNRTAYGRREYLRWHRAVVDALVSSLLAFNETLRDYYGVEADDLTTVIADTIRWRRGFALAPERLGQLLGRHDPERRETITAFHDYRRQYAAWTMYMPAADEQSGQATQLFAEEVWQRPEYDELWQAAYGDLTYDQYLEHFGEPSTVDVLAAVPAGAWLVEYWWYIRSSATEQRREYLVVLLGNHPEPTLAVGGLGPADTIDRLVGELVASAGGRGVRGQLDRDVQAPGLRDPADAVKQSGALLRELVLDPLGVLRAETPRLLIIPDGPLTRVSFAAMPTSRDGYVIDTHVVSYLRSAADLVPARSHRSDAAAQGFVVGGADFDASQTAKVGRPLWSPLPGTTTEAEGVAARLGVKPLTGAAATVDRLLAVQSPRVLHLATHGGMLPAAPESVTIDPRYPDHDAALVDATATYVFGDIGFLAGRRVPYQELRSVIALAGANAWLASGEMSAGIGAGHVNAEDILDLDLAATELVVLSACDTARGVLHLEEGVVGLRSSIRLAGAHAIVCALWPVPDLATAELTIAFYDELPEHSPVEALRSAQLRLREQHPHDPVIWAGFICEETVPA